MDRIWPASGRMTGGQQLPATTRSEGEDVELTRGRVDQLAEVRWPELPRAPEPPA